MMSLAGRARGFHGLARYGVSMDLTLLFGVSVGESAIIELKKSICSRLWTGSYGYCGGGTIEGPSPLTEYEVLATRLHYGIPSEPEMRDYSGINAAVTSGFHGPAKLYAGEGSTLRWQIHSGAELLVIRKNQSLGEWCGWVVPTRYNDERKPLTEFEIMAVRLHYGIPENPELEDYPDPHDSMERILGEV